ncbi:MAG: FAD:protein FMN transferase, partial [Gammaproteobacteria bacterium]|nr:FAD:protein FMN transferase [Gammaproteobacteria bacterium]
SEKTSGAFDITVGPLVNLWGFGPDGIVRSPPPDREIETAKTRVGYSHLQADCSKPAIRKDIPRLYLDLSAYAKGYAVDRISELLDKMEIADYLVEIGGEMKLRGFNAEKQKWAVAIEAPLQNERQVQRIFRITNQSVATSGDYRNFFESNGQIFSHTIDTRTGRPVRHGLASVTVVAETTAIADALATALLVLGPEDGMMLAQREGLAAYFLIRTSGGIEAKMSPAFALIGEES